MRGKARGLVFVGLAVMLSSSFAGAQPAESRVVNSSSEYRVVECEPGSIPETSIIDKTRKDIARVLKPEDYRQKYPGE